MNLDQDEIAEYYDDLQTSQGGGTILRPLHGTVKRDPTIRWGDTLKLRFEPGGSLFSPISGQFLNVGLDEPRVCSVGFHAKMIAEVVVPFASPVIVERLAFQLLIGVGSSNLTKRVAVSMLPTLSEDFDVVLVAVPLRSLYVTATAQLATFLGPNTVTLEITGQVSPI